MRLRLDGRGIDASLRIADAAGAPVVSVGYRADGPRLASFVAGQAGAYRVEVTALDASPAAGRYSLALVEQRPATAADRSSVRAMRLLGEAEALRTEWQTPSNHAAIAKLKASADLWKAAPGDQARAYLRLADLGAAMGDPNDARRWAGLALERSRVGRLPETECRAEASLSRVTLLLGDRAAAADHGRRALEIARAASDPACEAEALNAAGDVEAVIGNAARSLTMWRDARAAAERAGARRQEALAWLNIGFSQSDTSDVDAARASYDHARGLWQALGDRPQEAATLNALGHLHVKMGERQQALGYYVAASEIFTDVGDPIGQGISFDGLGIVYLELGEPAIARQYYERKLHAHRTAKFAQGEAGALTQIGHCDYAMRDYPRALEMLSSALTILARIEDRRVEAYASGLLGLVYEATGDRARALATYERALALGREIGDRREQAYALNRTARLLHKNGQTEEALGRLTAARELSRGARDRAGESLALFNQAVVERDGGRLDAALADIRTSLELSETLRTDVASPDLRAWYFAGVRDRHELHVSLLMALHAAQPAAGFDRRAFDASEQARARALLDGISQARSGIREGADPALVERERAIARELNVKAQRLIQIAPGTDTPEARTLARDIDALTAERATVDAQIRARSPRYASLTNPTLLSARDVQQQVVDDGSTLLQFFVGEEKSFAWVVSKDAVAAHVLPGRDRLDTLVRTYRDALALERRTPESDRAAAAAGAALADVLLGPLGTLGDRRLLVVPDGILQVAPIASLPDRCASGHAASEPLVAAHEIVHLPSASTLALLRGNWRETRTWSRDVMVFGDPVFEADDPRVGGAAKPGRAAAGASAHAAPLSRALRDVGLPGGTLSRLLETRREARAIAAVAPRSTIALGFDADRPSAVSASLADYRIVHFATHGLVDNLRPELSGVVLSLYTRTGQPQDGFLRLHDIYNLTLPVELVVLSACSTALGRDVAGEGLVGLVRGFMYAGTRRVVASLWRVDDEATSELMSRFYHHMFVEGQTASAALRASQLDLLRSPRWHSPAYWAAFVMAGDWN